MALIFKGIAAAALLLAVSATPAGAETSVVDLGVLPGDVSSETSAINASGVVVGNSYADISTPHAVRWDRSGRALPLPGLGRTSFAYSVNDQGVVVGYSEGADGRARAVRWDATGALRELVVPGATTSYARDVNSAGFVAGTAVIDEVSKAVRWDPFGKATVLALPAGTTSAAVFEINDRGEVAGNAFGDDSYAVRWTFSGQPVSFGAGTNARGFNSAGTLVGRKGATAARWDRSGETVLEGDTATDVNDHGQVVGIAAGHAVSWCPSRDLGLGGALLVNNRGDAAGFADSSAVKWHQGKTSVLPLPPGATASSVTGMNDRGAVSGTTFDANGDSRAVLWR
ncbi:hypothetical protein ACIA8G_13820 [Lentzea sp. NPDC051213]|uniref:hypothetical protein n=1 Tax=Lentzea sp. NPDC051213 TaxID=3364126 RepID=UPI0037966E17